MAEGNAVTAPLPVATIVWGCRPGGPITVPLGRHDPRVRWGFYDPEGRFVRELVCDEVPGILWTSSRITPKHPSGGHMLIDLAGGIYLAVLVNGPQPMPDIIEWR